MIKKLMAIAAVALLTASACGSRADDGGTADGGLGPDTGGGAPGTSAPDADLIGTLPVPCGPGDTSGYPEQTERGVTRDAIKISTISDPGGAVPGLNQGIFDTMAAFADWCNDLGGINGRKIEMTLRDAKLTEYKERVLEACDEDFAIVGSLGVFDELGAQDAIDCGLVTVPGATLSPAMRNSELLWQPIPSVSDAYKVGPARWLMEQYPGASDRAGMLNAIVPQIAGEAELQRAAYEELGFEFVAEESFNIGETNWGPIALALRDADAQYLPFVATYEELLGLVKALNEQGHQPAVIDLETNFYTPDLPIEAAALDLDLGDMVIRLGTWPFEEADERPAMAEYLRILDAYESEYDTEPEQLGVQSWSAALLWATAVDNLGADVTAEGLAEELASIHEWTSGGLHGPTDPGDAEPTNCFIVMRVTPDGFERAYPRADEDAEVYEDGDGFACPDDAYIDVPGFGDGD